MKLVVLGATGGTGLEILGQAIERGHQVTAFVRAPERLKEFGDRVAIVRGDLLDPGELRRVVQGHDGVLSGFGPRDPRSKDHLLRRFAMVLTGAMLDANVRRVVVLSVAFLFRDSIIPPTYLAGRLLFPGHVADAAEMEKTVRRSGLDWTIVRPPQLTDKPGHGKYRVRDGRLPNFGFAIARADVADFMIKAVENRASVGKIIGLAN